MDTLRSVADEMDAIRSELVTLDEIAEPTDEQVARSDVLLAEWDAKKADHDVLAARAERVELARQAVLNPRMTIGSGVQIRVKKDPFENLGELRHMDPNSDDMVARAITALSDVKVRGAASEHIAEAVRKVETIPGAALHVLAHGSPAYRSAFGAYLASGGLNPAYTAEEGAAVRTALSLTSANGGYILPTLLDPTLIHTGAATKNPIRRLARVETGTQNVYHLVTAGGVTTYWVAENTALTEGSPVFGSPAITAAKLTAYLTASYEIFEDSNMQAQLPGLIAEAFDYAEGTAFVSGSGSGAPKGIVTAISATTTSRLTCTTRTSFTAASSIDVFQVHNATTPRYEESSTWVANKTVFNTIRQMSSSAANGSLFWTDLNSGLPGTLLGSPIASSSDMIAQASITTASVAMILGDFKQFVIYDRIGTAVEFIQNVVDGSGLPTGSRGLVAHKRVGSDVTDLAAFRYLIG